MTTFTIGADPELFAADTDNIPRSLIHKIGGTKDNPIEVYPGYGLQEDNVAVEFNIPPAKDVDQFIGAINTMINHIDSVLREKGLHIDTKAAHSFPEQELAVPEAWVFGCEPDFNAWTRQINPKPAATDPTLRTAGGHVHIGTKVNPIIGTKLCDLVLGIPSVLYDTDSTRKELYGKAGAFRYAKKYTGFEYRVLSNFWIFDKTLIRWVYNSVNHMIELSKDVSTKRLISKLRENIIHTINKNDKKSAEMLMKIYKEAFITP